MLVKFRATRDIPRHFRNLAAPPFVSSQFLCHPDAGGISFAHFLGFFLRQNDKGSGGVAPIQKKSIGAWHTDALCDAGTLIP